jgi:hypothetical protein
MGLIRSIPHLLVENGSQICGTKVYDSAYETPATFVLFTCDVEEAPVFLGVLRALGVGCF